MDSVIQVLPFRAGNPKLEGTVRNEDPEGVPSKGRDMFLGHPRRRRASLSHRRARSPPEGRDQSCKVLADRGEEVVHAVKGLEHGEFPHRGYELQVPGCSGEAVLRADQRDRFRANPSCPCHLCLPGLEFNGIGGGPEFLRADML